MKLLYVQIIALCVLVTSCIPDVDNEALRSEMIKQGQIIEESAHLGQPEYDLGLLAYHMEVGSNASCGDVGCHNVAKAGYPTVKGGTDRFNDIMKRRDGDWVEDDPPVRVKITDVFNDQNTLVGGQLGFGGFNENYKDSVQSFFDSKGVSLLSTTHQFQIAFKAHAMSDLTDDCNDIDYMRGLCFDINGDSTMTKRNIMEAIVAYQDAIRSTEAPYQKWLRGEGDISYPYGLEVFKSNCLSCHSGKGLGGQSLSAKLIESDYQGHYSDRTLVKVPRLYNVTDAMGFMHDGSIETLAEAIDLHGINLTNLEKSQLIGFIETDLYDPNLARYVE